MPVLLETPPGPQRTQQVGERKRDYHRRHVEDDEGIAAVAGELKNFVEPPGSIRRARLRVFLLGGEVNRGFGFALTIGIVTGAAWANYAWGTYWSWDPKETWSLITWLIYAIYLHIRFLAGWKGRRAAIFAILGFLCVLFTYLGVNLVLSGLHSYGGMN